MKILALIVLVCAISLAVSQISERPELNRDQPRRDQDQPRQTEKGVMAGKRLLLEGKLGRSRDDLQHNFNGLITNVNVGDLALTHLATRVLPKGEKSLTEREVRERMDNQDEDSAEAKGVLFNTWIFSDKKTDRSKVFFLVRMRPEDLGTCYRLDSDRTALKDWVKSEKRCGDNNKGILYTFNYNAGEQPEFPIDMQSTLCLDGDRIKNISGIGLQRDQVLSAIQAHVVDELDSPDVKDANTFLDEFSLPFHCAVAARQLDVNAIIDSMRNLDIPVNRDEQILGSRDAQRKPLEKEEIRGSREVQHTPLEKEEIRGLRETRKPLEEIKPVARNENRELSFAETRKPIEDKNKLNKPVEY